MKETQSASDGAISPIFHVMILMLKNRFDVIVDKVGDDAIVSDDWFML
jgi:hypothetical protein